MPDIVNDGNIRVDFVPTIAATTLIPSVAEYTAGTRLDVVMTADGLEGFDPSTAEIDNTSFSSTYDTRVAGRTSYSGTGLVLKKQTATDTVHSTLSVKGTNGYIVIRDGIAAGTAPTAAQKVNVYPVQTGQWDYTGRGEANTVSRYRVPVLVTAAPALNVTVT